MCQDQQERRIGGSVELNPGGAGNRLDVHCDTVAPHSPAKYDEILSFCTADGAELSCAAKASTTV
jgi:hypothetical protein